ncbi:hypothetical protein Slin15195_G121190 [Septoria linicola]|uniref:Uncharacterized protein n=1 Tax=Septoria linicola TaxID=215465 RepID=A0A9Q9EQ66_9PEZI|nr:hypothetical protein Slin15195_G121190 [Septoria linicola]
MHGEHGADAPSPTTVPPQTPAWAGSPSATADGLEEAQDRQQDQTFLETMEAIGYRLISPGVPEARNPPYPDDETVQDDHEPTVVEDPFEEPAGAVNSRLPVDDAVSAGIPLHTRFLFKVEEAPCHER